MKDARRLKEEQTNIGKVNQQQIRQVQSKRQISQLWNKRQNKQTASIARPRTRASLNTASVGSRLRNRKKLAKRDQHQKQQQEK